MKNPDPYNGLWGGKNCRISPVQTNRACDCVDAECDASNKYIDELKSLIQYSLPKGKIAGMIAESIQGVGGTVQFTKGYIREAAKLIRENGGVFISDEVELQNLFREISTKNILFFSLFLLFYFM